MFRDWQRAAPSPSSRIYERRRCGAFLATLKAYLADSYAVGTTEYRDVVTDA